MRSILTILTVAALWWAPTSGRAQTTEDEQRRACTGDVMRLCLLAVPDRPRIIQCMRENRAQLSPACRAAFDAGARARPGAPGRG